MGILDSFQFNSFVIQWHLTERCNWYCKHCYRDGNTVKELPLKKLKEIFSQCLELFEFFHIEPKHSFINIGGGEPFLRNDFFNFLSLLSKYRRLINIGIMTNGSLITDEVVKDLKRLGIRRVQVSLEGLKETNDKIRGKGAFNKIIKAIKILRRYNITTRVSLTVTQLNLSEIEDLAVYLKEVGVNILGLRRFVPIGRGDQLKQFMLSPLQQRDFYLMRLELQEKLNERDKFRIPNGCEDGMRLLLFSKEDISNFKSYQRGRVCGVTDGRCFTIFPNGDVFPCRRLPILLGNAFKDKLLDIYFSSDELWSYRDRKNIHPLCRDCAYFEYCLGGARCVTFGYFKTPFAPDPQCWKLFKQLPKPEIFQSQVEKVKNPN